MSGYPKSLQKLIESLMYLNGIGKKSAQKMALDLVEMSPKKALEIARDIEEVKNTVVECKQCFHLSDEELCEICKDPKRDQQIICVVDRPRDVLAIERTREYKGVYHVLHGVLSPLSGVGFDQLRMAELLERVEKNPIKEVILANSPTLDGETTAIYLDKLLQGKVPLITRIAHGVPIGGDLEFSDEITLLRAMQARKVMDE